MLAAGLALAIWILGGLLLRSLESGSVLAGTSVAAVDVGGESRESAAELIAEIDPVTVEVEAPGRSFEVKAPRAGLTVDAEETADRAYSAGRDGIGAILAGPLFLLGDRDVEPRLRAARLGTPAAEHRQDRQAGRSRSLRRRALDRSRDARGRGQAARGRPPGPARGGPGGAAGGIPRRRRLGRAARAGAAGAERLGGPVGRPGGRALPASATRRSRPPATPSRSARGRSHACSRSNRPAAALPESGSARTATASTRSSPISPSGATRRHGTPASTRLRSRRSRSASRAI